MSRFPNFFQHTNIRCYVYNFLTKICYLTCLSYCICIVKYMIRG